MKSKILKLLLFVFVCSNIIHAEPLIKIKSGKKENKVKPSSKNTHKGPEKKIVRNINWEVDGAIKEKKKNLKGESDSKQEYQCH